MLTKQKRLRARVAVTQIVEVSIDDTKFTPEWMASFREVFYPFHSVTAHLKHLAQLEARGITYQPHVNNSFIEGYGNANDLGIKARVVDTEIEIL